MPPPGRPPWQALDGRLQAVIIVFVAMALYEVLVIVSDLLEIGIVGRIESGEATLAQVQANDDRQQLVGLGELALIVPAAVVFIRWFKRAYENVSAVGGSGRWGSGWAVGGWFVPFLNLWRPKQIANDIWAAANQRSGVLLGWWWAAWIVTGVLGRIIFQHDVSSPGDLRTLDQMDIVASVIWIAGSVLAIRVAQVATRGLEARNV